jgi:hypothetical protein
MHKYSRSKLLRTRLKDEEKLLAQYGKASFLYLIMPDLDQVYPV